MPRRGGEERDPLHEPVPARPLDPVDERGLHVDHDQDGVLCHHERRHRAVIVHDPAPMREEPRIGAMFGAGDVTTFMGLPAASVDDARGAAAILGATTATPYASVGAYCRGGPAAIRAGAAPYAANLLHMDFDLGGAIFPDG